MIGFERHRSNPMVYSDLSRTENKPWGLLSIMTASTVAVQICICPTIRMKKTILIEVLFCPLGLRYREILIDKFNQIF